MDTSRVFYVNTNQTFAGSNLCTEERLRSILGYGTWEVYWTHYSDEHPELSNLHRLEGKLTADEIFSLISKHRDHVGVLHLHQRDDFSMFGLDVDYWICPTVLSLSDSDKIGYIELLADRMEQIECGQLYRAMLLCEVFDLDFFEELVCEPLLNNRAKFFIHKEDILINGKFFKFRRYTIEKFSKEFGVMIKCH